MSQQQSESINIVAYWDGLVTINWFNLMGVNVVGGETLLITLTTYKNIEHTDYTTKVYII